MGLSSFHVLAFMYFVSSLLSFHLTVAHFAPSMQPRCHDHERSALLKFKESVTVNRYASSHPLAYPKVRSWDLDEVNSDCCSWDGIKCDEDTGHVIMLNLTSSYLYGPINSSSSLFNLVHLEKLILADNHFNLSEIPSQIMNLSRLSLLNLSQSYISGQIPAEMLELSNLVSLDLSFNDYNLELQKPGLANLVEKLTNLKHLDLLDVYISSPVPRTLANLSYLIHLSLSGCLLQGEFPTEIFQLPNLQFLGLMSNQDLTGYLPEFQENSPLAKLRISFTGFSGKIPNSIENLQSLFQLDIGNCSFSGTIPPSLGNLSRLEILGLSGNKFSGELLTSIKDLGSLKELDISFRHLSGNVATSLGNLTQLSYLAISGNNFSDLNSYSWSWLANLSKLTFLDLSYNNLIGEIPSALMNLTELTQLYLANNHLTGPIPPWLMSLNKLSELCLSYNQLSGHIPIEIGNLTQLQSLVLVSNQLKGSLPSSIFKLRNLEVLDLYSNKLSGSVNLHMLLLHLKSLETLVLSSNKLSLLNITTVNTNLQKFWSIGFGSCNLTEFPSFLYNQDRLKGLDLSSNKITGQVPGRLMYASTYSLEYLNLSHNLLTGFDQELINPPWQGLVTIDLRSNKLQGSLPIPLILYASSYLVSNNQLTGQIPAWICGLNKLQILDLSYNNLTGTLPGCLGNFSHKLLALKLQGNKFHGNISLTFMNETNLTMIDLSNNSLQGRIPKSLGNCVKLKFLNLGNNQIVDNFPSWLSTLPELEVLILKSNRFYGVVKEPKTGFDFPKLRIVDLSHNTFTGNLPSKYFECFNAMKDISSNELTYLHNTLLPNGYRSSTHYGFFEYSLTLSNKGTNVVYDKLSNLITAIILSNNKFVGEIPTSIASLKGLRNLNLSNNNLEGHISSLLGNLMVLESMDLSNNELSGKIPQQLTDITTLEVFDVSNNKLTGPIPQGKQFNSFPNSSFEGNPGLCGQPLSKKCENPEAPSEEIASSESIFSLGWKVVVVGYASGTILGVILGHIFITRKPEWLPNTNGLQLKSIQRWRGLRN